MHLYSCLKEYISNFVEWHLQHSLHRQRNQQRRINIRQEYIAVLEDVYFFLKDKEKMIDVVFTGDCSLLYKIHFSSLIRSQVINLTFFRKVKCIDMN